MIQGDTKTFNIWVPVYYVLTTQQQSTRGGEGGGVFFTFTEGRPQGKSTPETERNVRISKSPLK